MRRNWTPMLAMIGALSVGTASAQTALSEADQAFIDKAAQGGHAEVAMSESATKSENSGISAMGRQLVTDHSQLNDELAMIAMSKGVEPPTSASLGGQAETLAVSVLPGETFDSQFVSAQLDNHQETLALFQAQAHSGQDPELKAFAAKAIPIIEQHLVELEKLQQMPGMQ